MIGKPTMYDRRLGKPDDAQTSEERLWCLLDRRETADEIVRDVASAFADELAELIRRDRAERS